MPVLANGNFAVPLPPPTQTPTLVIDPSGGPTAAMNWRTLNNKNPGPVHVYTSTAIIGSAAPALTINPPPLPPPPPPPFPAQHFFPFPGRATHVLEVCTNGPDHGILQVFKPTIPKRASVDVFVLRGRVGMGISSGGGGGLGPLSTLMYTWEPLVISAPPPSHVGEFFVLSAASDGAWFFVANAVVDD
jgi:hypothetical protein